MTALRFSTVAACLAALTMALWPADSLAQSAERRAVPRQRGTTVRARPIIVRTRPVIRGSWFIGPLGWYPYGQYPYVYAGRYDNDASVRIQVPQRDTEVYVDGYYAGIVDDFDGVFQRLHVEPGEHELTLFLPEHQTVSQQVYLQPRSTFRIELTMEPLLPGDPPATRPVPAAPVVRRGDVRPLPDGRGGAVVEQPITPRIDREAQTATAFGTLAIQVQPADAEIVVDGDTWQRTAGVSRLLLELTGGSHRVEVRRAGFLPFVSQVVVEPGATTTLNVSLSLEDALP